MWSSRKTEIEAGASPPSGLVKLDDGRLVLVYGCRRVPHGIQALVSEDEGLTWRMDSQGHGQFPPGTHTCAGGSWHAARIG